MKISLEQLGRIRARRQQEVPRRGLALLTARHRWVEPVLLAFGVLCVVAFLADMYRVSRRSGGLGVAPLPPVAEELRRLGHDLAAGQRVKAASGLFSCVLPEGWTLRTGEASAPYDLTLVSPNRISISLSAARVPYDDLPALFQAMSEREREYNVHTDVQSFYLRGQPAARREVQMARTKALVIDLVKDHIAHQIYCDVPTELYDQYRPTLFRFIEAYQPLDPAGAAGKTP